MPPHLRNKAHTQPLSIYLAYLGLAVTLEYIAYIYALGTLPSWGWVTPVGTLIFTARLLLHVSSLVSTIQTRSAGNASFPNGTRELSSLRHSGNHRTTPAQRRHLSSNGRSGLPQTDWPTPADAIAEGAVELQDATFSAGSVEDVEPVIDADNLMTTPRYIVSTPLPEGCKRFAANVHVFQTPLKSIAGALFHKYAPPNDPLNPSVASARWIHDEFVEEHRIIHRKREVVIDLSFLPYIVRRALSTDKLHMIEHYEWHLDLGVLHSHASNTTLLDAGEFQEVATYKVDLYNMDCTVYESRIEIHVVGWLGRQILGFVPTDAATLLESHIACINTRVADGSAASIERGSE
jgi:hypothetical protein